VGLDLPVEMETSLEMDLEKFWLLLLCHIWPCQHLLSSLLFLLGKFIALCQMLACQRHSADLLQLDNGVKVPPSGWKCEKCDLRENLWLNLTDGTILCGRLNYDGSGGNNHAVEHYQTTGYPLAVKLGTITPDGAGAVVLIGIIMTSEMML